jgi:hypothetical protein
VMATGQKFRDGNEKITTQQIDIRQDADFLQVSTVTRGPSEDEDGYHWER